MAIQTIKRYVWFTDHENVEILARTHNEAVRVSNNLKRLTLEQKKIVHTEPDMVISTQCSDIQYSL